MSSKAKTVNTAIMTNSSIELRLAKAIFYRYSYRNMMNALSELILKAFYGNQSFHVVVAASPKVIINMGIGKSTYALKTLRHVYKDWREALNNTVFTPQSFIDRIEEAISKRERIKALCWDDAGFWLNRRYWYDPLVKAVSRLLQVSRPVLTTCIFTTPTPKELPDSVLDQCNVYALIGYYDKVKRAARLYKKIQDLIRNKKRYERFAIDYFIPLLPDDVYREYEEIRRNYVKEGARQTREAINKAVEELTERILAL